MTLTAKRRVLFWGYVLLLAACYYGIYVTARGAIDAALRTWEGIR